MSLRLAILLFVGLAFWGLVLGTSSAAAEESLEFLTPLRLPTLDGKGSVATWELRGKKLLLIEFASW